MADITPVESRFERCYCIGVTRSQAITAIKAHGCTSVDDLRAVTGACGGCGSCRPELKQLIHEVREQAP